MSKGNPNPELMLLNVHGTLGISAGTCGEQSKLNGSSEDAHHPHSHDVPCSAYSWLIVGMKD